MTRKPLGRGLGALLSAEGLSDSGESMDVDIELIDPGSAQPRTRFDAASLRELADSIKANGVRRSQSSSAIFLTRSCWR
jgi:ParB family chromosome partitioning protein